MKEVVYQECLYEEMTGKNRQKKNVDLIVMRKYVSIVLKQQWKMMN